MAKLYIIVHIFIYKHVHNQLPILKSTADKFFTSGTEYVILPMHKMKSSESVLYFKCIQLSSFLDEVRLSNTRMVYTVSHSGQLLQYL